MPITIASHPRCARAGAADVAPRISAAAPRKVNSTWVIAPIATSATIAAVARRRERRPRSAGGRARSRRRPGRPARARSPPRRSSATGAIVASPAGAAGATPPAARSARPERCGTRTQPAAPSRAPLRMVTTSAARARAAKTISTATPRRRPGRRATSAAPPTRLHVNSSLMLPVLAGGRPYRLSMDTRERRRPAAPRRRRPHRRGRGCRGESSTQPDAARDAHVRPGRRLAVDLPRRDERIDAPVGHDAEDVGLEELQRCSASTSQAPMSMKRSSWKPRNSTSPPRLADRRTARRRR